MKIHTFDIKVAIVGYVSVGKSTVLNALLGDKFSQVNRKPCTAGVNFFRITQPLDHEGNKSAGPDPEQTCSTVNDDETFFQDADAVHKEILKNNKEKQLGEIVKETTFDVRICHQICKMRKDTRLVLIDIPGINEAESNSKYRNYVESNWNVFDSVVVVMNGTSVDTDLLKFVKDNNEKLKNIPTIILGNKLDDLYDDDTIEAIEETRSQIIEIFGNIDYQSIPHEEENVGGSKLGKANSEESMTAFIPLSAKNAFTYMKAGSIDDLEQLGKPKYRDFLDKIGLSNYGKTKWLKMKVEDKKEIVSEFLKDPKKLEDEMASTNFNSFLFVLSTFVGGDARQRQILAKQVDIELKAISYGSVGEEAISDSIFAALVRCKSIGRTDIIDGLKEKFWEVYQDCENKAFEQGLEQYVDPAYMERPFKELERYYSMALQQDWTEESSRAIDAMKKLLRRQLSFLLVKLDSWSFQSYCLSAGGKKVTTSEHQQCAESHCSEYGTYCQKVFREKCAKYPSYFLCGEKYKIEWKRGWMSPKIFSWITLSPRDWMIILDSLSLVWNQSRFIEDFGPEKLKLQTVWMNFHGTFGSFFKVNVPSSISNPHPNDRICLRAYRDKAVRTAPPTTIRMPDSLVDPSHWGFLAWKYINFGNLPHDGCGGQKRKASDLSQDSNSSEDM